jgi:hypothetical protein
VGWSKIHCPVETEGKHDGISHIFTAKIFLLYQSNPKHFFPFDDSALNFIVTQDEIPESLNVGV